VRTRTKVLAWGSGAGVVLVGSRPLTFAGYGVNAPELGSVTVDEHGAIEFSLHLILES
jgi:hypothetical protein